LEGQNGILKTVAGQKERETENERKKKRICGTSSEKAAECEQRGRLRKGMLLLRVERRRLRSRDRRNGMGEEQCGDGKGGGLEHVAGNLPLRKKGAPESVFKARGGFSMKRRTLGKGSEGKKGA